jgi:hypothetical protein
VCGIPAALHAHQVTFVADACETSTPMGQEVSLRRLQQEDITVSTTASVVAELAGDYQSYSQIMRGS